MEDSGASEEQEAVIRMHFQKLDIHIHRKTGPVVAHMTVVPLCITAGCLQE